MTNTVLIDRKFILLISPYLELFEKKSSTVFICRCPVCGDSKWSKTKKRFYFIRKDADWMCKCHNCNYTQPFYNFLEQYYPQYIKEYRYDIVKQMGNAKVNVVDDLKEQITTSLTEAIEDEYSIDYSHIMTIDSLPASHPARTYVERRMIPKDLVFYVPVFSYFMKKIGCSRYEKYYEMHEPKLIIPFYNENGNSQVFQARSFDPKTKLRYITCKIIEEASKMYGLERIDWDKPILVLEGPIDSLMLPNALAAAGSYADINALLKGKDVTFIMDNEPRNKEIVRIMSKYIKDGYKVLLWPHRMEDNDINDMIIKGYSVDELLHIIHSNAVSGYSGKILLEKWKKC